jgi:hypothetical protein
MRPTSDPKTRAATLKKLLSEPGVGPESMARQEEYAAEDRQKALDGLAEGVVHIAGYGAALFGLASRRLLAADQWGADIAARVAAGMEYMRLVARYHAAVGSPKTDREAGRKVDTPDTALNYTIWTAFLDAHFGRWDEAQWLAEYLLGYLHGGDVRVPSSTDDAEYFALSKFLIRALAENKWPLDVPAELGPYRQLLQGRRDATAVADALVKVADLRMARAQGYAQVDDARPIGPYAAPLLMSNYLFVAVPAELWAIKALARRLDGIDLNLDADHPWLRAGFMQAPNTPLPPDDDDVLQALRKFGDDRFRVGWHNT